MATPLASQEVANDLRVYLGDQDDFNWPRALLVVDLAIQRAEAVITPVPASARSIILDVAVRGYLNPQGIQTEAVGPFSRTFRSPGVYVTDQERAALLELGPALQGAFTIRPSNPVS